MKFKKGDKVRVFNKNLSGKRIFEGIATVVKDYINKYGEDYYMVVFDREKYPYLRYLADAELIHSFNEVKK